MESETQSTYTSPSSPGQDEHRERLLSIYDELDDAGRQELLHFAVELSEL